MNENEEHPKIRQEYLKLFEKYLEDYPGYGEAAERRISDESVRAAALAALENLLAHLPSLRNFLAANFKNNLLSDMGEIENVLDRASQRLEAPPYAVSLFFSARRINDETAQRIADSDWEIVLWANRAHELLRETLTTETDFNALLARLLNLALDLELRLDERFSLIGEYQG